MEKLNWVCAISSLGSFLNHVDQILSIIDHPPKYLRLTFYCYKEKSEYRRHFSTTYLPFLVNLVKERLLIPGFTQCQPNHLCDYPGLFFVHHEKLSGVFTFYYKQIKCCVHSGSFKSFYSILFILFQIASNII